MNVKIKKFEIEMEVKTNGIELEVRTPDGTKQLGDLIVSKTGLKWCKGKSTKGKFMTWEKFTSMITDNGKMK